MSGKTLYNKYRKAHGKVVVPTEHPAMHDDTLEDLPEFETLTEQEQKAWNKIDRK